MNIKSLAVLAASTLITVSGAKAAITDNNHLLMGFRATGGTGSDSNLVIDLGTYASMTPSGYSLDFSSGSSVLSTTYGSSWWNRNDLYWGVVGTDDTTLNTYLSRPTGTALPAGSSAPSPNIAAQDLYTISGNIDALQAASTAGNASYSTVNGHSVSVSGTGNSGSWSAGQSIGWGFFSGTTDSVVSGNTNLAVAYYTWNTDENSASYGAGLAPVTPVATIGDASGIITVQSVAAVPEPGQVAASLLLLTGIVGFVVVRRRKAAVQVA